jgi:hypothetical protein
MVVAAWHGHDEVVMRQAYSVVETDDHAEIARRLDGLLACACRPPT